jgi:hypothetical protein
MNYERKYPIFAPATWLLTVLLVFYMFSLSSGAPVIPNSAVLEGTVMEYCITSSGILNIVPEQPLYKLTISVEVIKNLEGSPNFLKGKEGQVVTFFTKAKTSSELFGKRIKASAEYKGDERGGRFWINTIETMK